MDKENNSNVQSKNEVRNKKEMLPKIFIKDNVFWIFVFLLPFVLWLSINFLHRGSFIEGIKWVVNNPNEAFFNYLIAFSLINAFLILARNKLFLIIVSFVILVMSVLAYISQVKIELRGEPLILLDFLLIGEATNIMDAFDSSYYTPIFIIVAIWVLLVAIITAFVKMKVSNKFRFGIAFFSFAMLGMGHVTSIEGLSKMKIEIPADVSWNHEQNGFLLATLVDSKFLKIPTPENYNKESIEEVYNKMIANVVQEENEIKPNVIFVLSESMWDLTKFTDLKFNEEPMPFFKELSQDTLSGYIQVPGIGGGTVNTEFEILTGMSRNFIRDYAIPYNPYSNYVRRPIHSLGTIFSELNYDTMGVHPYYGWFYRRSEVYQHLGFDKFIPLEAFLGSPKKEGLFVSDSELNNLIVQEIENTPNKNFISAMTMQGHGPYNDISLSNDEIKLLTTELNSNTHITIENYANLMRSVDDNIKGLVEYFEDFEEPTVIVFYSDHIPPFGNEIFKEIGFDIYGDNGKRVPMLVWSNYLDLEGEIELNANMLSAYVLDLINVKSNLFMNHLYSLYKENPFANSEVNETLYQDFELLHYDIMHGERYFYEFVNKPDKNESYELGYPLEIEQVLVEETKNAYMIDVIGQGISSMSVLYLNEVEMEAVDTTKNSIKIVVEKEKMQTEDYLEFVVKIKDTRGKIFKTSNELIYKNIDELLERSANLSSDYWNSTELNEELEWEFFAAKEGIKIVRVDLNIEPTAYFVEKEGNVLMNKNADKIVESNQSNIYPNGYLYISIDDNDSNWEFNPTSEEIKKYFEENEYTLNIAK